MAKETHSAWFEYRHFGNTHYRIWTKRTEHGGFQRHEWKREDDSMQMENWIAVPW